MTYFHVPAPLLAELTELLERIESGAAIGSALVRDRANIARFALKGINVFPSDDNKECKSA